MPYQFILIEISEQKNWKKYGRWFWTVADIRVHFDSTLSLYIKKVYWYYLFIWQILSSTYYARATVLTLEIQSQTQSQL